MIERDKLIHFAGCAGLTLALWPLAGWLAALAAAAVGVAKELLDSRSGGTGFSVEDLIADALGIGVAVLLMGVMYG